MLYIHNDLTRKKERFNPIDPANVRMYVCGMTVYDYCHIGHARVLVVFDMVNRYLRHIYGDEHVTYVRNITDIDDKIIKRAREKGEPYTVVTSYYIDAMREDAAALGVQLPDAEPRATLSMEYIVAMIRTLVEKGYAYTAPNGDVYYDVSRFPSYGRLSGKRLEELRVGERVAVDEAKEDPLDFVLWKAAKPGEPSWDSPWGKGRPGWHIECSAMSVHCLGSHFDIHGGGLDLQFPHHENEIAQSEAATGCKFVNYWMHNGFVRVDDEKMSKSLDNFFTIREVLQRYDPEVLRYFILASHYRSPLNYSDQHLDNARAALTTLYTALRDLELPEAGGDHSDPAAQHFFAALDDDFNTPEAMAVLFELAREINRLQSSGQSQKARQRGALLRQLAGLLGLLQRPPERFLQRGGGGSDGLAAEQIERLIAARNRARAAKQWSEADRIREELKAKGIILEDRAGTTTWRRE